MNKLLILPFLLLPLTLRAADVVPDGTLIANGQSANTYEWITSHGYQVEPPDRSRQHASVPFQHVQQTWDSSLGSYVFQFFIHALIDDDRGLANVNDRQRCELKTSAQSPAFMVGQEGDSVVMRWKFLLPEGMITTNRFTHIHQLKGIDNKAGTADVSYPLITFTCCAVTSSSPRQELQVRWQDRFNRNKTTYLARTDLKPLLGQWLEAEECVRYGANGSYSVVIRNVKTGAEVLRVSTRKLDMWRTDCAGLRPKWGIYRYIGDNRSMENQLRDEELHFADFAIVPVTTTGINTIGGQNSHSDAAVYTLQGQRVPSEASLFNGIYIVGGRKVVVSKQK